MRVLLLASDLLDLAKSICGVSQNRLHLLRSWRYRCTVLRHREAAPILRPSTYKQQSGVNWLSKIVQQSQQKQHSTNPTAILQESNSNTTAPPQVYRTTSTAIPQQSQSNAIVKSDIDATAIPQQSYTIPRQSHSKTGARAEIPYSNCAVLTPQLHHDLIAIL